MHLIKHDVSMRAKRTAHGGRSSSRHPVHASCVCKSGAERCGGAGGLPEVYELLPLLVSVPGAVLVSVPDVGPRVAHNPVQSIQVHIHLLQHAQAAGCPGTFKSALLSSIQGAEGASACHADQQTTKLRELAVQAFSSGKTSSYHRTDASQIKDFGCWPASLHNGWTDEQHVVHMQP